MGSGPYVMRTGLGDKLKFIRRLTGDKFSAAKGYDLRKPMSKARQRTIAKYFEAAQELTSRSHTLYTPKKGQKREAFQYTGQERHPRFQVAIVHTPDEEARYDFAVDKARPKGSRFVTRNRRTGEQSWHIPAVAFDDDGEYEDDPEAQASFFADVLTEYGERGQVYVIAAGESHMWGNAGSPQSVGEKLTELFRTYGAGQFDPADKNSHHINNWFRGVQVYAPEEFMPYLNDRITASVPRTQKWGLRPGEHFRRLRSGDIGHFYRGSLLQVFPAGGFEDQRAVATKETGLVKVRDDDE